MNTTITRCDSCKKTTDNARMDGWIIVRNSGIEKMSAPNGEKEQGKEFGTNGLDFCSWRCFRKHWRGRK